MRATTATVLAAVLMVPLLVVVLLQGSQSTDQAAGVPAGALNAAGIPEEYRAMVEAAGTVCKDVPAAAIAAQLQHESRWDPRAVSPVGAQGLAQFMPGTWATWGRDANANGTSSPFDPADAIDAQARFMCHLADYVRPVAKATGAPVLDLAWAAYNAGPGRIDQYRGIPPFAETQNYVRLLRESVASFTASDGSTVASGTWAAPLPKEWMIPTSPFGPRISPCAGCSSFHKGQDFGAPAGVPVLAACDGTVDFAGVMSGYGNITFVNCGGGIRTGYAHQSAIHVTVGQKVQAGQKIGLVGSTGVGTGAHLHFEVHTGAPPGGGGLSGTAVDPRP